MASFPVLSDEDLEDIAADYRGEQSYFNNAGAIPRDRDGLVARFAKIYDAPDSTTYDCLIVDRTTGKVVTRYDAADPANTRVDYGAKSDDEILANLGYDIKELVDPSRIVTTPASLSAMVSTYHEDVDFYEDPEQQRFDAEEDARLQAEDDKREEERYANRFRFRNAYRKGQRDWDSEQWFMVARSHAWSLHRQAELPTVSNRRIRRDWYIALNRNERNMRNAFARAQRLQSKGL
jgi:hypothetical protein